MIHHNKNTIPPLLVLGNSKIKSIEILVQEIEGMRRGIYKSCGFNRDFAF